MEKITCPNYVRDILQILIENGFEAYIVGGCVRDSLLGKIPHDWDITTNAKPEAILNVFKINGFHTIETGLKHGTVTVERNKEHCEITTYRIDGNYSNNRQPDSVKFTKNLIIDLSRRDFTINAIAYNDLNGFIDPFNGINDIEKKIIRCVENPFNRFNEDALRILRALRFSFVLNFTIEKSTMDAIYSSVNLLDSISYDRRREEFCKMLLSGHNNVIMELRKRHVLHYIIPELETCYNFAQNNPYHIWDVLRHISAVVDNVTPNNLIEKLAAVYHDIGKPMCKDVDKNFISHFHRHAIVSVEIAKQSMTQLHFDNKTINQVLTLVKYHDFHFYKIDNQSALRIKTKNILKMLNNDVEILRMLMHLRIADCKGQNPYMVKEEIEIVLEYLEMLDIIEKEKDIPTLKTLNVNGNDLIALGLEKQEIGLILNNMLDYIILNPEKNDKNILIEMFKEKINYIILLRICH